MKIQLRLLFAGVMLLLLGACATSVQQTNLLTGTWTNSTGTVWTIKPDGTFDVDVNHDGKKDISGTYTMSGDNFTITHNEGKIPKGCEGPGVYKFKRSGDTLTFTLVSDSCKPRKKNLLQPWHSE